MRPCAQPFSLRKVPGHRRAIDDTCSVTFRDYAPRAEAGRLPCQSGPYHY